jgi:hypothetical protein
MGNVSISLSVVETKHPIKEICEICDVPAVDRPAEKVLGPPARSPASTILPLSPQPIAILKLSKSGRPVCRFRETEDAPAAESKG